MTWQGFDKIDEEVELTWNTWMCLFMVAGVIMGRWEAVTPSMSLTMTMPCTRYITNCMLVETSARCHLDGGLLVVLYGQGEYHEGEPVNIEDEYND